MKYEKFRAMCRRAWSEKFNYLCIDMSKKEKKVNIVFSLKTKTHILIVFAEVNILFTLNVVCN